MPIYEYVVIEKENGCVYCREKFEIKQSINEESLTKCPKCNSRIRKVFSSISIGASKTSLDRRAKDNGFHKLKRVDKGKYEKLY